MASGGSAPTLVGCDVEVLDELDEVWRRARVLETVGKQHRLLFEGQTVAETLPLLPGMYRVCHDSSCSSAGAPSVLVPSGSVGKDPVQQKNASSFQQTELLVYNEEQVRLRYLVRVQHSQY